MYRYKTHCLSLLSTALIPLALSLGSLRAAEQPGERAQPTPTGQRAEILVNVPLDAIVWVDGQRTGPTGMTRRFVTPPLAPGRKYGYDLRVTWIEGGRAREAERHVSFKAGDRITLNYSRPNWTMSAQDLYTDPAAPAPWRLDYYQDPLNYPNYPNFLFPGIRWRPR